MTTEGRIIATLLMIVGVGIFGTFTGFVASWFVEERELERDKKASTITNNSLLEDKSTN